MIAHLSVHEAPTVHPGSYHSLSTTWPELVPFLFQLYQHSTFVEQARVTTFKMLSWVMESVGPAMLP